MDLPNIVNNFFFFQCISSAVFFHSSFLSIFNIQEKRLQIMETIFKRGITNRRVKWSIIRVLNINQNFILGIWMIIIGTPQKMNQFPIDYFCLWMESCRSIQLSVHVLLKCIPKSTNKSSIPIWDDTPWYLKVHLYIFKEHVFYFLSFDGHFSWHKNAYLAKLINSHKEIIISLPNLY
jgi:hypothetical protein